MRVCTDGKPTKMMEVNESFFNASITFIFSFLEFIAIDTFFSNLFKSPNSGSVDNKLEAALYHFFQ